VAYSRSKGAAVNGETQFINSLLLKSAALILGMAVLFALAFALFFGSVTDELGEGAARSLTRYLSGDTFINERAFADYSYRDVSAVRVDLEPNYLQSLLHGCKHRRFCAGDRFFGA